MNPASPDPARLLGLAETAAAEAASMLAARRSAGRPGVVATKSSPTDVVTEADRTAEAMIIERIRADRPGDGFLGEEGGQRDAAPGSGPGLRCAGSSIRSTGPSTTCTACPTSRSASPPRSALTSWPAWCTCQQRGEVFTAVTGGGGWLRAAGRPPVPMRCNRGVPLARALVATGFGYAAARRRVQGEVVAALLPLVRDIRRSGSAAVDLCSVAAGRVDAYYERGANYWDIAAGGLIAREAGARMGGLHGHPAGPELTVAAGPGLFDELTGRAREAPSATGRVTAAPPRFSCMTWEYGGMNRLLAGVRVRGERT